MSKDFIIDTWIAQPLGIRIYENPFMTVRRRRLVPRSLTERIASWNRRPLLKKKAWGWWPFLKVKIEKYDAPMSSLLKLPNGELVGHPQRIQQLRDQISKQAK